MSPICASPLCMALTMSVPVSTTFMRASTPCFLKKPFSAPMNIGRWPKLLPITTSSVAMPILPVAMRRFATPIERPRRRNGNRETGQTPRGSLPTLRRDRVDRLLAAQHARDIARALGLQLVERVDRVEPGVWGEDHVGAADER